MKRLPAVPLAWGGALLIALLLAFAVVVLVAGRVIEREALAIETDSVPGLIDGHVIRSAYAEGFICAIRAAGADAPGEREAFIRRIAATDATAGTAVEAYTQTIHVDPRQDTANYREVVRARDRYLAARTQFVALVQGGRPADSRQFLSAQLTPAYEALIRACDVLIEYNNRTGTAISAGMVLRIGQLRWTVIAVIGLALLAGFIIGANLVSSLRAERALRDSEAKFSTAFRVSPNSMVISRRTDGRIVAGNDAFKRLYGLVGQEVAGKSPVELGVWQSAAEREAILERMGADGRVENFVNERVLPSGRRATFLVSCEPMVLDGDECLISVLQDITGVIEAEQALARSAEEFRAIFESAAIGITLVTPEGRLIRCNPALERMLGYRREELCQMTFAQFTHPDDVARDKSMYERLVAGGENVYQLEKRYVRKDGAMVWGHLTVSALRGSDGKVLYGIGMVEDVSERRRAEQALSESETARENLQQQLIVAQKLEAVGQLAGGVAHDFNNMLAAIMLHLDLLKVDPTVSPSVRESLGELIQAARRAAGLTRQLLLFSRREPVQRQVVDLNAIVSNLLKMLDRLVGEHLTLVHAGGSAPLWLLADSGMLEQVVMNLVVNARDAMPRGGRIVLRTEVVEVAAAEVRRQPAARAGRFVRLTVVDAGCGMNAATRARIFEPFFTTKDAGKGTGLGLSTVLGIVQLHAGWVEVESAEGQGSSFAVYLPAHTGPVVAAAADGSPAPATSGHETILLAEDYEPVRLATAMILRRNGYRVIEAADGRAAKAILDDQPGEVDLLITDVVMPGGLLGHELAAGLPAGGHRPKVILMSGHNTQVDVAAFEASTGVYLAKPFHADHLLRVVRETLGDVTARA